MSAPVIRKAAPSDLDDLLPLVAAYHAFEGVEATDTARREAVARLLADSALGMIICADADSRLTGYLALCYGYSIEFGGQDAFVDEFFVVPDMRGHGLGEALMARARTEAATAGIVALHLEVDRENAGARRFYERRGFSARDRFHLMSAKL